MGTRNLTMVTLDGETKVAQYGQWDGYPTGQGVIIAKFLKRVDLDLFKEKVRALRFSTEEDSKEIQEFLESIGSKDGWLTMDQSDKYAERYPALDRDLGASILKMIYETDVEFLIDDSDFKNDTLFCEYWYEINLDNHTVSVNGKYTYPFEQWTVRFMADLEDMMLDE